MIKIYGIANCDTMKKVRRWLEANGIEYEFHDYKKHGVPEKNLKNWVKQAGWETVLNKRGTTWRKLGDDVKNNINEATAIQLMLNHPSIIKRPVLESDKLLLIGFKQDEYEQLLL
jgi:Spx/MgsR family transcriptional regulator